MRRGFALAFLLALIGGCATVPSTDCERFERQRRRVDYDTHYIYSEAETRRAAPRLARASRNARVAAAWYTLRMNRTDVGTCEHLYLIKDLYLRHAEAASRIEEIREFYTAGGQLIATRREDLTRQLDRTGFYTASVPLPIPPEAPAGRYRVVTRLVAADDRGERTLAQASAEFRVTP